MKLWLPALVLALVIAGSMFFVSPKPRQAEAAVNIGNYQNFTYSTATQLGTWQHSISSTDTFPNLLQVTFPAGTTMTAAVSSSGLPATPCGTLPTASPANCTLNAGVTLTFTFTTPFPQTCAAQTVLIGPLTYQWGINGPTGTLTVVPASNASLVGGVSTPNNVPANSALCPTPIVPTATPTVTPTATPIFVPGYTAPTVIPVFQNPAAGGLFNPIAKTPTPRPVVAAAPPSYDPGGCNPPPGQGTAGVCLRPPNTGDAGLKAIEDSAGE